MRHGSGQTPTPIKTSRTAGRIERTQDADRGPQFQQLPPQRHNAHAVLTLICSQLRTTTLQVRLRFYRDRGRASEILTRLTGRGDARKVARGTYAGTQAPATPPTPAGPVPGRGVEFNAALNRPAPAALPRSATPAAKIRRVS